MCLSEIVEAEIGDENSQTDDDKGHIVIEPNVIDWSDGCNLKKDKNDKDDFNMRFLEDLWVNHIYLSYFIWSGEAQLLK